MSPKGVVDFFGNARGLVSRLPPMVLLAHIFSGQSFYEEGASDVVADLTESGFDRQYYAKGFVCSWMLRPSGDALILSRPRRDAQDRLVAVVLCRDNKFSLEVDGTSIFVKVFSLDMEISKCAPHFWGSVDEFRAVLKGGPNERSDVRMALDAKLTIAGMT